MGGREGGIDRQRMRKKNTEKSSNKQSIKEKKTEDEAELVVLVCT